MLLPAIVLAATVAPSHCSCRNLHGGRYDPSEESRHRDERSGYDLQDNADPRLCSVVPTPVAALTEDDAGSGSRRRRSSKSKRRHRNREVGIEMGHGEEAL